MSRPLLHLDLTSEDTLYSTDSTLNKYILPWQRLGNQIIEDDAKYTDSPHSTHVNVAPSNQKRDENQHENQTPFPYSSSFNYYYNPNDPVMQKYHVESLEDPSILSNTMNSRPLSPLSILCPATNLLVQSRTLEECNDENNSHWRRNFLKLMSDIITYSEDLESTSTELLRTESRVRELVLLQKHMEELYEEREKAYKDRLKECHQTSLQQLNLIQRLEELDHDLDTYQYGRRKTPCSIQTSSLLSMAATTLTTTSTVYKDRQSSEQSWRENRSALLSGLSTRSNISAMEDLVHMLRWEVGLRIGGGVGTGHVIHSFEGPLNGIELIIAGSGIVASAQRQQEESFSLSNSIQRIRFHKHLYVVHINHQDRETGFRLLPKSAWIPDELVSQCQFRTCKTVCSIEFNLFQRRHHCRRCGIVICQRHSLNRLPLFETPSSPANKWHRVCDGCFYELIIVKCDNNNSLNDSAADLSELATL